MPMRLPPRTLDPVPCRLPKTLCPAAYRLPSTLAPVFYLRAFIFIMPSEVPVLRITPRGYYDDALLNGISALGALIYWSVSGLAVDFFYYLLFLSEQFDDEND